MIRPLMALAVLLALCPAGASARDELGPFGPQSGSQRHASPSMAADPPLMDGLGTHTYSVSTSSPRAQAYFDQGLRWSYAFNHAEAARAFRAAQRADPDCAMCAWGEALVLGPNINKPMDEADAPAALAALERARAAAAQASPREQALIAALAKRYSADSAQDRAALDSAYAEAMAEVANRFRDDFDIQALAAEAMMDAQPWDYWEADKRTPKGNTAAILATLERVLAADPDHVGAAHLYIHAVEASDTPQRALPYAKRLAAQMPAAGHIVHMPSHIYYRLGMWRESLEQNKLAAAADERYFAQVGKAPGIYRDGYYPHNIHFLLVSAQMAGDGPTALSAANRLAATVTEEGARSVPWSQPIKAAPYFTHAQFSDPQTVLALPDPGDGLPYVKAMWHYARGSALAESGEAAGARAEAEAIRRLSESDGIGELETAGVPASGVLAVAGYVINGLAARSEGDMQGAVARLREAAVIEDKLSYTEPPWWYYPVRQTLGATLLMAGDPAAAEREFAESLRQVPNNGWALYGLAEAQAAQGQSEKAARTIAEYREAWAGAEAPQLAGL